MSESICLHIQEHEHEAGPIRIVEVPWISVRIGKAAFCEVRLTDPDLPDEVCRLHRRGRTWLVAPAPGASTRATIDGVEVDSARPLPFDASLRIGRFSLSLKRSRLAEPDWRAPRPAPASAVEPPPLPAAAEPGLNNPWEARWRAAGERLKATAAVRKTVAAPPAAPRVPLVEPTRPEAPPPRIPKTEFRPPVIDRPEPARAPLAPSAPPLPIHPVAPLASAPPIHPAPPIDPQAKADLLARLESLDLEWLQTPAPEAAAEEKALERGWESEAPAEFPALPAAPETDDEVRGVCEEALERGWESEASAEPPALPAAPEADDEVRGVCEEALEREWEDEAPAEPPAPCRLDESLVLPDAPEAEADAEEVEVEAAAPSILLPSEEDGLRRAGGVSPPADARSPLESREADALRSPEVESPEDPTPSARPFSEERREITLQLPSPPDPEAPREVAAAATRAERWIEEEAERLGRAEHGDEDEAETHRLERFDPTRSQRSRLDRPGALPTLPSVQDVLDASLWRSRDEARTLPRPPKRAARPAAAMVPTTPVEPPCWSPPVWLVWPPAAFFTVAVAAVFTLCSWWMAVDSYNASLAIKAATATRLGQGKDRPLPQSAVPPASSWWRTTPLHLAEWAVHLNGTRVDHGFAETPADLIAGAEAISPVSAMARLVGARLADAPSAVGNPSEPDDARASVQLGLSRDVVSLALTARSLHRAGKTSAAIPVYRRALEIASRTEPTGDAPLVFCDDPNVPRYLPPGEAQAAAIVREMADDPSWTPADWAEAIPEANLATLAAARVLKEMGRSEADPLLKRIVERLETEVEAQAGAGGDPDSTLEPDWIDRAGTVPFAESLRHAIIAEALALQGEWRRAERHYKAAVAAPGESRIKRSWWFNLAEVAGRLNDEKQRGEALDEALASIGGGDDVSRRVLDLHRVAGPSGRSRSNPIKAN